MRTAWLGTGLLGGPMAVRLAAAGHEVVAWNRTAAKVEALRAQGVHGAATAAAAMARADCVVLALQDAAAITSVLFTQETSATLRGRTVIQMGTIGPLESVQLATLLEACGSSYIEAPVLGSIPQAASGTLLVLVGSTSAQFAQWRGFLAAFGPDPVHVGAVGQAATLKLALNQLIASLTAAFSFSLGLVQRSGLDVDLFMCILRQSALYAPTFDKKLARMRQRDFSAPNFSTHHMLKDVRLILDAGRRLGLETAAVAGIESILVRALECGHADSDYSSLYEGVDAPASAPAGSRPPAARDRSAGGSPASA